MRPLALLLLVLLLPPLPAQAQDWCGARNLTPTERTICNDRILRRLDRELARIYAAEGHAGTGPAQRDWLRRRAQCGTDLLCIERGYRDRIAELRDAPERPVEPLRPWCRYDGLNATEREICGDPTLADMDAAMAAVYGQAQADTGDAGQQRWLREERNACEGDRACIANAYLRRIVELGRRLREG